MIEAKNAKHLNAVTITGDWDDLNDLYDAISHIKDLYFNRVYAYYDKVEKEGKELTPEMLKGVKQDTIELEDCIYGLMYEIRHAYQGDREFEYRDNGAENIGSHAEAIYNVNKDEFEKEREKGSNGNLYFGINVLYPWMLYYMIALNTMRDSIYRKEELAGLMYEYDVIRYRKDEALVKYFVTCVFQCVKDLIGDKQAERMFGFMELVGAGPFCRDVYGTVLCQYYCDEKKTSKTLKKHMVVAIIYTFLGSPYLDEYADERFDDILNVSACKDDYLKALAAIKKATGYKFPEEDEVYNDLKDIIKNAATYTDVDVMHVCEKYGNVDWEKLKY